MTVDFGFKRAPKMRIASVHWKGPWNDARIRREFESVARWIRAHDLPAGRWVFLEPATREWRVGIEVRGRVRGEGRVRIHTLPATRVASVTFDPDVVSPRVVYHGLNDWLRWRKKDRQISRVVSTREVYSNNPWTDRQACARTEIQYVVRP